MLGFFETIVEDLETPEMSLAERILLPDAEIGASLFNNSHFGLLL